jgi:hypothetical protein
MPRTSAAFLHGQPGEVAELEELPGGGVEAGEPFQALVEDDQVLGRRRDGTRTITRVEPCL